MFSDTRLRMNVKTKLQISSVRCERERRQDVTATGAVPVK
jgi:hypothetical protein